MKVKLRPSTVVGKEGVIYYQIIHHRERLQITTRLYVDPSEWDADKERPVSWAVHRSFVRNRIDNDVAMLQRIISKLDAKGDAYSVHDVVDLYKFSGRHTLVTEYMQMQIEQLRATNRHGTAENYKKTMGSFRRFLGDVRLSLEAMNEQVIADYNTYLIRRGLMRNSISFYMRVLRAVYNKAVRQKLIVQEHPFTEVYTGIDRTRKRAVSESIIVQLSRLKLSKGSQLALCRDLFIFSYCTRGMAFVDMAFLRKSNLQNGMICYTRRKSGQRLAIRIEPRIQAIVDRYATSRSNYLFPIITAKGSHEAYKQYRSALNGYNRMLHKLAELVPGSGRLTSYTSRHSWATAARNHNVPISVISAGMGHTTEQTTRIYLSSLENSIIDDANRLILDSLR